jgi:predicted nucleic acid-binding protein
MVAGDASIVLDTNVYVYALLGPDTFRAEAADILRRARGRTVASPLTLLPEFTNAAWSLVRAKKVTMEAAITAYGDLREIVQEEIATPGNHEAILKIATERDHPAYDVYFAAVAMGFGTRVVTYDERFRAKFPDLTIAPAEFLAAAK